MRAESKSAIAHRQGSEATAIANAMAWLRDVRLSLQENWVLFVCMFATPPGNILYPYITIFLSNISDTKSLSLFERLLTKFF